MLVPALLANQAAMCYAHTHHGSEPAGHSQRAHVHLSGQAHASHSHSHHHGDSGEHEHSDDLPIEGTATHLGFDANFPADHDSDALFFGEHDNLRLPSNRIRIEGPAFASMLVNPAVPRLASSDPRPQISRAGPLTPFGCAIFLQTRRLLL
jgi:hypothetical protein